ncbi:MULTISPECIES: winged helix-turn-helix domain-containing protein [Haloferax]|uniref:Helix-turn-helix domain-containing protein n=2 Tax=Haloferax TaxID=2251 RepID=A0A6G1Z259_9EURY|nr:MULTISPECIES: helix-turn-helix domain-containing protein [Haloferax]KAB1187990.1 helix-turn-helix domain-containing protein [Haloferax sp. CBA1149]MRW80659.1 helix-turn-helix domain-containing protein [Haloferax marinisediminis]
MTQNRAQRGEELLDLLVHRSRFVEALAERPRDKRTLAEDLDTSRSTVDRVLRDLQRVGFVRKQQGDYELTVVGRCALESFERYERAIHGVSNAQDLLRMLPRDAPLDPALFAGARVFTSSPDIPDGVIQELFTSVEEGERLYGIAPVAITGQLEPFYDAATAGGTEVEMIVANELLRKLLDAPRSRAVMVEQLQKDAVNIYRAEIPFGFGLWAVDDEAGIVVYTDTGVGGLALNDDPEAISWVTDCFASLQDDAELVTLSSIGEQRSDDTE